jgi:hypothetical protein
MAAVGNGQCFASTAAACIHVCRTAGDAAVVKTKAAGGPVFGAQIPLQSRRFISDFSQFILYLQKYSINGNSSDMGAGMRQSVILKNKRYLTNIPAGTRSIPQHNMHQTPPAVGQAHNHKQLQTHRFRTTKTSLLALQAQRSLSCCL